MYRSGKWPCCLYSLGRIRLAIALREWLDKAVAAPAGAAAWHLCGGGGRVGVVAGFLIIVTRPIASWWRPPAYSARHF